MADGPAPSLPSGGNSPANRLLTLDALRGVAVMAILLANLPGFGLPDPAYSNPLAWGSGRTKLPFSSSPKAAPSPASTRPCSTACSGGWATTASPIST